jgi:hypothetical protein
MVEDNLLDDDKLLPDDLGNNLGLKRMLTKDEN